MPEKRYDVEILPRQILCEHIFPDEREKSILVRSVAALYYGKI